MVYIGNNDRFLLLKLMNALYGLSLAENAVKTQELLSKIITFLRYATIEGSKLVRVKEELDNVSLFVELMSASTGNNCSVSFDINDRDLLNLYIPSKSLLQLFMEIFTTMKDTTENSDSILIKFSKKDASAIISIEEVRPLDINKIRLMEEHLKKSFENLPGSSVSIMMEKPQTAKIFIKVAV